MNLKFKINLSQNDKLKEYIKKKELFYSTFEDAVRNTLNLELEGLCDSDKVKSESDLVGLIENAVIDKASLMERIGSKRIKTIFDKFSKIEGFLTDTTKTISKKKDITVEPLKVHTL